MPKSNQALVDYWEAILASEGMADISLFDNTGKPHSVNFISTTCEGGNNDWYESVNICENGQVLRFEDLPLARAARKLSHDVASLPSGWPAGEFELLRAWADTGNFLGSCKELAITLAAGWKIRRRFEQFVKDSNGN